MRALYVKFTLVRRRSWGSCWTCRRWSGVWGLACWASLRVPPGCTSRSGWRRRRCSCRDKGLATTRRSASRRTASRSSDAMTSSLLIEKSHFSSKEEDEFLWTTSFKVLFRCSCFRETAGSAETKLEPPTPERKREKKVMTFFMKNAAKQNSDRKWAKNSFVCLFCWLLRRKMLLRFCASSSMFFLTATKLWWG